MTTEQARRHPDLGVDHMRQARLRVSEGNLPQASRDGWLAVEALIQTIAEQRGWACDDHLHLWRAAQALADEAGDREIGKQLGLASVLYANSDEDWLDAQTVALFLDDLEMLTQQLRRLSTTGA